MKGVNGEDSYAAGVKAARGGNLEKALRCFNQAISEGAAGWEPLYARAWTTIRLHPGEVPAAVRAEADLRRALAAGSPACPDAVALLASLCAEDGRLQEAVRLYLQAFGRSRHVQLVESGLVGTLARLLNELEQQAASAERLAECEELEKWVACAALPKVLADGIQAEILLTERLLLDRLGRQSDAAEKAQLAARLAPEHPRLPKDSNPARQGQLNVRNGKAGDPTFEDIGGRGVEGTFQARLCTLFETYLGDPDLNATRRKVNSLGQSTNRSILLFGPSGCGKTYIIRAFAGEYRKRFGRDLAIHQCRLNEVLDRYVGESEKILTRLFDQAIETQPSILFADEVDAIAATREKTQEWQTTQTGHFLQEVDRLQTEDAFVIFFACTNRIWNVDLALLRRFDQLIPVELPGPGARAAMFRVQLARMDESRRPENVDYELLARVTHGLTPGDIRSVIRRAVDGFIGRPAGPGQSARLDVETIVTAARQYKKPMHVRDWYLRSIDALRKAGHDEMAEEVVKLYGPYVDLTAGGSPTGRGEQPEAAWYEEQQYDLTLVHRRGARR